MTFKAVAAELFQRPTREAGAVEDISLPEACSLLGMPHASVEDPRCTASGMEVWWVFEIAGIVVGLCHRTISDDVVIYAGSVTSELKADLGRCFADFSICWQ